MFATIIALVAFMTPGQIHHNVVRPSNHGLMTCKWKANAYTINTCWYVGKLGNLNVLVYPTINYRFHQTFRFHPHS